MTPIILRKNDIEASSMQSCEIFIDLYSTKNLLSTEKLESFMIIKNDIDNSRG